MLVHLRLVVPADLTDDVVALLLDDDRITNVTLERDAALQPRGDLVGADVAREAAESVLDRLDRTGLPHRGGISLTAVEGTVFDEADRVDRRAAGAGDDGVIWQVVRRDAEAATEASGAYFAFLGIATALAAVAVITDSPILVVGAMVVGPDFGPVGAMCAGLALRSPGLSLRALWLLVRGYVAAVAAVTVLALVARATGVLDPEMVTRPRPATGFIWRPDLWSVVVAVLAGAAGVLAMTAEKSSTLVGVFISVTTVPAAGNLALALAVWQPAEVLGSLAQLGVNVVGMVAAGTVTMVAQHLLLRRLASPAST